MSDRAPLSAEIVESMCARIDASNLPEHDRILIKAALRDYVRLGQTFLEKSESITRLLRMIFGSTEKASKIIPELKKMARPRRDKRKGHGRNGASSYRGDRKVTVSHASLKKGNVCPGCQKGKVYPTTPGVTVRISGSAPLAATSFELEKLRCNLCGEVFTAKLDARPEKYDATAGAMIALLK